MPFFLDVLFCFLCCLANAATREDADVPSTIVQIQVYQGVMLQARMSLSEGGAALFPEVCYPHPSHISRRGVEDEPPAKMRRIQSADSPETSIDVEGRHSSQQSTDEEGDFFDISEDVPHAVEEVVVQTEGQGKLRQAGILRYLIDHQGSFVPEENLQKLYKQNAIDVLEDVMALIAEKYHIIYQDKQYRLCASGAPLQPVEPDLHPILLDLAQNPVLSALSAAEQSYLVYAQKGLYVPVSTMALWIEIYKTKEQRGASERRLHTLLCWKNRMLLAKKMLTLSECRKCEDGFHGRDLSVIRKSMKLHAQGREVLKNTEGRKRVKAKVQPADQKYPEIGEYLEKHKGERVCESTLKDLMQGVSSEHKHRDMCCAINELRIQNRNIICFRPKFSGLAPKGKIRSDGTIKCDFTLEDGDWWIADGCYRKRLWQMLDEPETMKVNVAELFLDLSNNHYAPHYGTVEEIKKLKKILSDERSDVPAWMFRGVMDIVEQDDYLYKPAAYYQEKMGMQEKIPWHVLTLVKRLMPLYQKIHDDSGRTILRR